MGTQQDHVLHPPKDQTLRKQLEAKLKEYQKRKRGVGKVWEFIHPELAHRLYPAYRDACYKEDVLSAILEAEKPLDTWQLFIQLAKKYDNFNVDQFCNACAVVAHYLGEHPGPVVSGTGLPAPSG